MKFARKKRLQCRQKIDQHLNFSTQWKGKARIKYTKTKHAQNKETSNGLKTGNKMIKFEVTIEGEDDLKAIYGKRIAMKKC